MRFKGTAILALVFLALGAFVYFTELRGKEERQQAEEAKKKVIPVEQKDIVEISLIYPDRTITGVKKGEKQWEITTPPGIDADSGEWDMLAGNVARIEREQTVTGGEKPDLAAYGLESPSVRVAAKLAGGNTVEVLFGAENPRKIYNYAKLGGSNEVFLTPSSWPRIFTKTVSDLRNKKVLEFEADDIDGIRITERGKEIEVQKSGEDWQLKKPLDAEADNTEVTTFLSSLRFARASSFPDSPVDAKTAGLDPPVIRVALRDAKAKTDRILLVGKSPETDKFYARDASREIIFIIDKEIAEKARRPVFDWRDKSITKVQRDNFDEIHLTRGAEKLIMKKAGSDWKLAGGRKLQWDKVSSMLSAVEFEKAKAIVDSPRALSEYGLEEPKIEAAFRQGANQLLHLAFGADSNEPEGVYLKTSDSPAVKVVSKDVFDKFNVKVEDLVETTSQSGPGS